MIEGPEVARLLLAMRDAREAGDLSADNAAKVGVLWTQLEGLFQGHELSPVEVSDFARRVRKSWREVVG